MGPRELGAGGGEGLLATSLQPRPGQLKVKNLWVATSLEATPQTLRRQHPDGCFVGAGGGGGGVGGVAGKKFRGGCGGSLWGGVGLLATRLG